jgi:hypothetical protein
MRSRQYFSVPQSAARISAIAGMSVSRARLYVIR